MGDKFIKQDAITVNLIQSNGFSATNQSESFLLEVMIGHLIINFLTKIKYETFFSFFCIYTDFICCVCSEAN